MKDTLGPGVAVPSVLVFVNYAVGSGDINVLCRIRFFTGDKNTYSGSISPANMRSVSYSSLIGSGARDIETFLLASSTLATLRISLSTVMNSGRRL